MAAKLKDRAAKITARDKRVRQIYKKAGKVLRPEDIIEDARDPKSPLHDSFEWDDSKAAHAYRMEQARRLIREIRVDVEYNSHEITAPVYVQDTRRDKGYIAAEDLKSDRQHAAECLARRLRACYSDLAANRELASKLELSDAFDRFLDGLEKLRELVGAA
jgi:hypothetical protein